MQTEQELREEGAIEYAQDILEGLDQLATISDSKEAITIKKVMSTIEVMMCHDFNITADKLDS